MKITALTRLFSFLTMLVLVVVAHGYTPVAAAESALPRIVYKPPLRGAPLIRVGGGTRGTQAIILPVIEVLAPNHVGLTQSSQPRLYWYIAGTTTTKVEMTLIEATAERPVLELSLSNLAGPAIHVIDLSRHGIALTPNVEYEWSVALVPFSDARSNDIVASAAIRFVPSATQDHAKLASEVSQHVARLAEQGIWYDAFDTLSQAIASHPEDPANAAWRKMRATLLEQVGLAAAATFDSIR